jgi:hypothetical protein
VSGNPDTSIVVGVIVRLMMPLFGTSLVITHSIILLSICESYLVSLLPVYYGYYLNYPTIFFRIFICMFSSIRYDNMPLAIMLISLYTYKNYHLFNVMLFGTIIADLLLLGIQSNALEVLSFRKIWFIISLLVLLFTALLHCMQR